MFPREIITFEHLMLQCLKRWRSSNFTKTFLPDYCIFPISHIVLIHMHIFIHEGKNGNNNSQETNTCFRKKYLMPPPTTLALIDVPTRDNFK